MRLQKGMLSRNSLLTPPKLSYASFACICKCGKCLEISWLINRKRCYRPAQLIPLKPGWQVHVYPPLFSKQVPPFWHGDEWHLSSSEWKQQLGLIHRLIYLINSPTKAEDRHKQSLTYHRAQTTNTKINHGDPYPLVMSKNNYTTGNVQKEH